MDCPCGSGASYSACCGSLHGGVAARLPSALMRARYSAYAVGNVDFIIRTTHPLNPHYNRRKGHWRAELISWCKRIQCDRLEIVEIQESEDSKEGYVTFRALLRIDGKPYTQNERSYFLKTAAGWLYRDGTQLT